MTSFNKTGDRTAIAYRRPNIVWMCVTPMPNPYPYPPLQVFERLQIDDGLLMTADLWRRAHGYHRQRHGFTFQSLYYPGIIYGLEVATIPAPDQVPGPYRDGRWLEIQPGVAIDVAGRPIVVPEPLSFRVELEPPPGESRWVYLTVRHVDPDTLRSSRGTAVVRPEQFRLVEKMTLDEADIELCRIRLHSSETGGAITLHRAADVFAPVANELDLRHRPRICPRPDGIVRLAQLITDTPADRAIAIQLQCLLKSIPSLYPHLSGDDDIDPIRDGSLIFSQHSATPLPDLIYTSWSTLQQLGAIATESLTTVLDQGGMLLVNAMAKDAGLESSYELRQELRTALAELEQSPDVAVMRQQLATELAAFDREIHQKVQQLVNTLRSLLAPLGYNLTGDGAISPTHPLRLEPFLFGQWPLVDQVPITVLQWEGVILLIGDIASLWGPDETMQRSRSDIRTAQEFGVNLLLFAWQHHHLIQLQGGRGHPSPAASSDSLRDRIPPTP
ncbi:MAG: hypothetical protein VKJ64_09290 [Leptolyngbyaceae bacterium]|nr:hypothetical protein [Leptolyngbyaceae bacterium]